MTQIRRLTGGLIDRQLSLNFEFDGKKYTGYQGDTLASALLANGVQLMGRSFNITVRVVRLPLVRKNQTPLSNCVKVRAKSQTPVPLRLSFMMI